MNGACSARSRGFVDTGPSPSGLPPRELLCGLQAGHPRHRHVEHGKVDVLRQGDFDRLSAVARLGHDLQVRR